MKPDFIKQKWCWVATQVSKGWRLKLCMGEDPTYDTRLEGILLSSEAEVKRIVKGNIVFVHQRKVVTKKTVFNK